MNIVHFFNRVRRSVISFFRWLVRLPRTLNLMDFVIDAVSFPQHDWAKRIQRGLADDQIEITWLQAINPIYWVVWTSRFVVRWVATRPYSTLTPALPAMIVVSFLIATIWIVIRRDETDIQTRYLDTLRTSLTSGDTEVASVAVQRLLAIAPENLEHQYQLAILDDELGKSETARRMMLQLAIQKEYGPAALWVLKMLVYESLPGDEGKPGSDTLQRRTEWSSEEQQICHRCATIAMTKLPSERAIFAKKMYAGFLADNGALRDAIRLYDSIADVAPEVNLTAAQLANRVAQETGDYITVQRFAKAAIRHLEPRLNAMPTSAMARIHLAQALVLDERDEYAFQILIDGMKFANDERIRMSAGECRIFTAERLRRKLGSEQSLLQRGKLLFEAVQLAPRSPLVLESVVQYSIECSKADDEELVRVRSQMLKGIDPAAMHFIEGTVALMDGDSETAERHLSLAANEWDNMAGLLNNLAVTLASRGDREQLEHALKLSNASLVQLPGHPYLLETRGQILLKLERYEDAITDLEKALVDPKMRPLAHDALADAYEALGDLELAKQNRELARRYTPAETGREKGSGTNSAKHP